MNTAQKITLRGAAMRLQDLSDALLEDAPSIEIIKSAARIFEEKNPPLSRRLTMVVQALCEHRFKASQAGEEVWPCSECGKEVDAGEAMETDVDFDMNTVLTEFYKSTSEEVSRARNRARLDHPELFK